MSSTGMFTQAYSRRAQGFLTHVDTLWIEYHLQGLAALHIWIYMGLYTIVDDDAYVYTWEFTISECVTYLHRSALDGIPCV